MQAAPVRLKFLLGEWLLATWRLRMVPVQRPAVLQGPWPTAADIPDTLPIPEADGFWVRQAAPELFSLGVGRIGQWVSYVPRTDKLHYVQLTGTFDAYLGKRSAKSRYNLKRAVQQLQRTASGPMLEVLTEAEDMARFHSAACAISRETYQTKLLDAGLPDTPAYLSSMQRIAEQGCARGYLLKEHGEPIAFAWCTSAERQLTYQIIGYLPQRASLSPGTVLLTLILEDLFHCARYDRFDFGVGDAPYKTAFATDTLACSDVYLFRPGWRHACLVRAHWYTERLSAGVGKLLERWGLKKRIRSLMRSLKGAGPP
jgi:hypothetical protein